MHMHGRTWVRLALTIAGAIVLTLGQGRPPARAAPTALQVEHWTIGLDPGHGWAGDPGSSGNGLVEKDVTLQIALLAKQILESQGYRVVLSRTADDANPLSRAAEVINMAAPDLVVSIHTNSVSGGGEGTESCYTVGKSTDADSQALATLLTDQVSSTFSLRKRGDFPENAPDRCARSASTGWAQLYIHDMDPPTALIETAFLSNADEAALLRDRPRDVAAAIARAVNTYVQSHGGTPAPPDDLDVVAHTNLPVVSPGETLYLSLEVQNTGTSTWRSADGYHLENTGNPWGGETRFDTPGEIAPAAPASWAWVAQAPLVPGLPSTTWQMHHGDQGFGPEVRIYIVVLPEGAEGLRERLERMIEEWRRQGEVKIEELIDRLEQEIEDAMQSALQRLWQEICPVAALAAVPALVVARRRRRVR